MTIAFSPIQLDKWTWHPSPLVYQVVLITTCDDTGAVDIAPRSNCAVAAFEPLIYGFGCQQDHLTYRNLVSTGEFTVNVPGVALAKTIWAMPAVASSGRLAASGLTTTPGKTVNVPAVEQCGAHLECVLEQVIKFDSGEVFVLGEVRLIEVDERCLQPEATTDRYEALGTPFVFLEPGWLAPVGRPSRIGGSSN